MSSITLQHVLGIVVTLALLLLVFELVRRKRLSERYAILWLLAAATLFVLAAWKGLLTTLAHDVGISYPPSALFAVAIGLIAMILLNFSLAVSDNCMERLNITLDDEQAEKLVHLAEHMYVQPGTVARSLLSSALDDADPDARNVAELLEGIPGAHERAQLGLRQATAGETISLDEL